MSETISRDGDFFFQRRFFPMFTGFTLGVFTDNMLKQALLIGLTFSVITIPGVSNAEFILPFAGALFALAILIFSSISGQVADKYETSMLFRQTKLAELFLMIMAAIGFLINSGPLLVLTLFLMGVQSAFFSPARISAMPKYLAANELVRANGICYGGLFVANLTGYAIGGWLIGEDFGPWSISIILVVMATIGWRAIHLSPPAAPDAPDLKINWNIFQQTNAMIKMVRAEPPIIRPLLGAAIFWFIAAAITVEFTIITKETLHADNIVATAMMGIFAVGGLLGATITTFISKNQSGLSWSIAAFIVAIVTNIALFIICQMMAGSHEGALLTAQEFFQQPGGIALAVLFTIASAAMGVFLVPLQAAIQRRVKETYRARIMAAGNMLNAFAAFVGSISTFTIAITALRPHDLLLGVALIELVIVIDMYRRSKTVPVGLYDEELEQKSVDN